MPLFEFDNGYYEPYFFKDSPYSIQRFEVGDEEHYKYFFSQLDMFYMNNRHWALVVDSEKCINHSFDEALGISELLNNHRRKKTYICN